MTLSDNAIVVSVIAALFAAVFVMERFRSAFGRGSRGTSDRDGRNDSGGESAPSDGNSDSGGDGGGDSGD